MYQNMYQKWSILLITVCLAFGMVNAWGQSVGTLNGTILDPQGAVVPGATVVVTDIETKAENKTTTTSAGAYTVPYLPQGTYTIRVTMAGFRTATAENVILRAAQTLTINISLEVGQVREKVTVSDTPPLLEAGSAEMGTYVNQAEFKAWPIFASGDHRMLEEFVFDSMPGTAGGAWQGSINGGQTFAHQVLIDGIELAGSTNGDLAEMTPTLEAVGDFKLQTGAVGAEYNGTLNAVSNFSMRSGTNDLHGSAYYFLQNEDFNALALGATKAPNRENNWGYAAGGPVIIPKLYNGRNRTFWFSTFEHNTVSTLGTSGFVTFAPMSYRTGDFSQMLNPTWSGQSQAGTVIGSDALGRPVVFGAIYDPATTRIGPGGAEIRDPFPGNIIPTNRINPVAAAVINTAGLASPTYNTMVRNQPAIPTCCPLFHEHIIGIKVDQIINDKNRVSVFYNQGLRPRINTNGGSYLPIPGPPTTGWAWQDISTEMGRLHLTSTITPTLINDFALGYNRFMNQLNYRADTFNQNWDKKLGIQNLPGTSFPNFFFGGADFQGGTIVEMGAATYVASSTGSEVLKDDATKIWGKHTIKFGYGYTRYFEYDENYSSPGSFSFSPAQTAQPGFTSETGNAFASFMLGAVSGAGASVAGYSDGFRGPMHALYIGDDIKITPKLTMNVGFRWEIVTPFYERTGRMSYIDLSQPDPAAGGLPGLLVFKNRPSNTYLGELGPRLGFAYQLTKKIVLRAGYAMTNMPGVLQTQGAFTTGYNADISVSTPMNGFPLNPSMYLGQPFPSLGYTLPVTDPASASFNAGVTTAPDANRPPYSQNYNFTVQYQLPQQMVVQAAYVGNKGTRLVGYGSMDVLPATNLKLGDLLLQPVSNYPQHIPYSGFPTGMPVAQAMLPWPQYYGVYEPYDYNTNSEYNSLQVTVTKHLTQGLGFLAAYTWSKWLDYTDNSQGWLNGTVQDYYNRGLDHSVSGFNQPQNFKLTWTYDTPFGKGRRWDLGKLNYPLGGWQMAAIQNYASGTPIAVYSTGLNTPAGFGAIRPNILSPNLANGSIPGSGDYSSPTQWLNAAAFANVPTSSLGVPLTVGTAPRNLGISGYPTLSETIRVSKAFPFFRDKAKAKVGMTMSNPFKRQYTYLVDAGVGDSAFGQILAGGAGRTMQLDVRIDW